jgi:basic membrane protein A and related proteins
MSALTLGAVAADGGAPVRIGLVLEQPSVTCSSNPFQCGAFLGLQKAARELPIHATSVAPSPTRADSYAPLFSSLARQGYNLVIAVGFLEVPALAQAVRRFTHVKFGLLDANWQDTGRGRTPANLDGTVFHTEEPAYLAGFVAARIADRGGPPHVVSSVGGYPIPPVQAYIAGFEAGARAADPKITVLRSYADDFANEAKCRHAALAQIARGSKVVFNVAGSCGVGALQAAKRKGVYGIGVDIDQSNLGKFILTSVVKNLNVAVYDFAKRFVEGRLKMGGNLEFDLRNGGRWRGSREVRPGRIPGASAEGDVSRSTDRTGKDRRPDDSLAGWADRDPGCAASGSDVRSVAAHVDRAGGLVARGRDEPREVARVVEPHSVPGPAVSPVAWPRCRSTVPVKEKPVASIFWISP